MAKPKPMVPENAKPVNLVLRSPWSARENPPQDLGYRVNQENVDEGQGDHTSTRRFVRTATPRTKFQNTTYTNQQYMTKVFHFLPKKWLIIAGYSTLSMEALETKCVDMRKVNVFVNESSHLGPNYLANLLFYKNKNFEDIQSLFNITQKLILEHSEEMLNVNTIDSASHSWTGSVLSHDQVVQWTKAKVRVFSDSFECMERMSENKDASARWVGQVEEFKMSLSY